MTTADTQETSTYEQHFRQWVAARGKERHFSAAATPAGELEIAILDIIGVDWWTGEGVTAKWVKGLLDANPDATSIRVLIDSPGGSVFDGVAICNLLKRAKANVEVEVLGEASSAASVIAMAGNKIHMHEGATMMIHRASTVCGGFAEDFRTAADALDSITGSIMDIYVTRTGRGREDVDAMVKKETWMSASEAVAQGFADDVIKANGKAPAKGARAQARAGDAIEMHFDTSALEQVTEKLGAAVKAAETILERAPTEPAQQTEQINAPAAHQEEERPMSETLTTIRALLNLSAGTPDSDVTAAVSRMRDLEREVVSLTGAKSTEEAVGGVRAMSAKAANADRLGTELGAVRTERDQQNFDAQILRGQSEPVKLTPALVTMYKDEFKAAQDAGNGSSVVERLKGFLAAAPAIITPRSALPRQPAITNGGGDAPQMKWGDKTYAELSFTQRAQLSSENPDLWKLMKSQWEQSQAA